MARAIPRFVNHQIYFDNYYTSLPLLVYLRTQGIYSLGTVRRPRLPDCKLPLKFDKRGGMVEYVAKIYGVDVSTVAWMDNKVVNMASTFAGIKPFKSNDPNAAQQCPTVSRFDKKTKATEHIACPNVIHQYNRYMGGVDLMDSCLGRCRIRVKSRKWTHRLFYHMMDMAMINAWILYRRAHIEFDENRSTAEQREDTQTYEGTLTLHEFICNVAHCLTKSGVQIRPSGRPSLESEIAYKRQRVTSAPIPPKDVRLDNIGHFPEHTEGRHRCKVPSCTSRSRIRCMKCNVHLCLSDKQNCFTEFHQR